MWGTRVRSLNWEDSTCCGATKPMCHSYWTHALQLEKPLQGEARLLQLESGPTTILPQLEKALVQEWRPRAPKNNNFFFKKRSTVWPSNSIPRYISERNNRDIQSTKQSKIEKTQMSINWLTDEQSMVYPYNGILSRRLKYEVLTVAAKWMNLKNIRWGKKPNKKDHKYDSMHVKMARIGKSIKIENRLVVAKIWENQRMRVIANWLLLEVVNVF